MISMAGMAEAAELFVVTAVWAYLAPTVGLLIYAWGRPSFGAAVIAACLVFPPAALMGPAAFRPSEIAREDADAEKWEQRERTVAVASLGILGVSVASAVTIRLVTNRRTGASALCEDDV